MKNYIQAILHSYSEVLFLRNYWVGALLLGATLINPNLAIGGLIAVVSAYVCALAIHMDKDFLHSGFFTYNPLMVGLAIGYLFKLTPLTIFYLVTGGISTFILTAFLNSVFAYYLKLPILSLPFVIITTVMYMAAAHYSNLTVIGLYPKDFTALDTTTPIWLAGFLKSLGSVFFLPHVLAGLIVLLIILGASRILFFLTVSGYYFGTLISALLLGSTTQAFANINHFNYSLIAMAVGGIFLIPSPKSYLLAMICVSMSIPIIDSVQIFWSYYGIPGFTLPFVTVTLTFVYVLGLVSYPQMTRFFKATPEENLDHYLTNRHRYRGLERTLSLPFAGKWTVWQGFDGQWTHQGSWKYAYDFVITDEEGHSHQNEGHEPGDYYAFRKPVLSPVRGRVIEIIRDLPDNPIGEVDRINNWGNLVIIEDPRGFFVELSHFAYDSVTVEKGQWVERNTFLGLCGNSGYSPQPHIHVQAQAAGAIGSYTLPFSFVHYLAGSTYHANELPAEASVIEAIFPEKSLELKTTFVLDDRFQYSVLRQGKVVDALTITVKMAADGTFYFDSGEGQLYFGTHEGTFYFYRMEGEDEYLRAMFLALPRLPLTFKADLEWHDFVPVGAVTHGFKKIAYQFFSSFYHNLARTRVDLHWISQPHIEGKISSQTLKMKKEAWVELDERIGFKTIKYDNLELRRVHDETRHS